MSKVTIQIEEDDLLNLIQGYASYVCADDLIISNEFLIKNIRDIGLGLLITNWSQELAEIWFNSWNDKEYPIKCLKEADLWNEQFENIVKVNSL